MKCKELFNENHIDRVIVEDHKGNIFSTYTPGIDFDYVINNLQGNFLKLSHIYLRTVHMSSLRYREVIFEVEPEREANI